MQRYLLESLMATNVNKVIVFLLINNANMYASTLNTKEKLFMPKYLENMTKGFHISEIKWNLFKKLPIFTEKLQYLVNGLRFGFYYGLRFRSNRFKHSVKRFGRFGLDTLDYTSNTVHFLLKLILSQHKLLKPPSFCCQVSILKHHIACDW